MSKKILEEKSDWLLKATLLQMPTILCKRKYAMIKFKSLPKGSQICAHDPKEENTADTCPGNFTF